LRVDVVGTLLPADLNPDLQLFLQTLADADVGSTAGGLRVADSFGAPLLFLDGFVDAELARLHVIFAQREELPGPRSAIDEDPKHNVLASMRLGEQTPNLLQGIEPSARLPQKLRRKLQFAGRVGVK
jgi:hypothetical protein